MGRSPKDANLPKEGAKGAKAANPDPGAAGHARAAPPSSVMKSRRLV
jgi:hypothetical protein